MRRMCRWYTVVKVNLDWNPKLITPILRHCLPLCYYYPGNKEWQLVGSVPLQRAPFCSWDVPPRARGALQVRVPRCQRQQSFLWNRKSNKLRTIRLSFLCALTLLQMSNGDVVFDNRAATTSQVHIGVHCVCVCVCCVPQLSVAVDSMAHCAVCSVKSFWVLCSVSQFVCLRLHSPLTYISARVCIDPRMVHVSVYHINRDCLTVVNCEFFISAIGNCVTHLYAHAPYAYAISENTILVKCYNIFFSYNLSES